MDGPPEATGTKHAQNESTGEQNFTLHSLKTMFTSKTTCGKANRGKQGAYS